MITVMMTMMNCKAQTICPESSTNCSVGARSDGQYVYWMTCFDFGQQDVLPAACSYSLVVRELTVEPGSSEIGTLQARALDGLRVQKLVLSGLSIETVNGSAFQSLAGDLTALSLDNNRLTTLPDAVFRPLTNLVSLQLHNNRLTTVSAHLLDGLANLLVLDLSGNQIGEVDYNDTSLLYPAHIGGIKQCCGPSVRSSVRELYINC